MHCLAYSCGAISVGIETLGRISYFDHGFCFDVGGWDDDCVASLERSLSVGDVDLLDVDTIMEETSEGSVVVDEAIEAPTFSTLVRVASLV